MKSLRRSYKLATRGEHAAGHVRVLLYPPWVRVHSLTVVLRRSPASRDWSDLLCRGLCVVSLCGSLFSVMRFGACPTRRASARRRRLAIPGISFRMLSCGCFRPCLCFVAECARIQEWGLAATSCFSTGYRGCSTRSADRSSIFVWEALLLVNSVNSRSLVLCSWEDISRVLLAEI